ncbi:MAG: rhomboid family intramembrane serine protease [Chitinophagales bacterium]|nr:rhomboid family intramembrane serine protease [Chitinophagales bacterium]
MSYYQTRPDRMPPVVTNLLIINGLFFLATYFFQFQGIDLRGILGMYNVLSPNFKPYQLFSHMFMHANIGHIFFNMFALWMFGSPLENVWGHQRFLLYYIITGLGAAALHLGVGAWEIHQLQNAVQSGTADPALLDMMLNIPTVGASGAVFGLLLGFGMLFPNTELIMLFFPVPIKAKYFVIIYGLLELFAGIGKFQGDNVAHFAHLGGMLFGFILIKLWQKDRRNFF